ncbi:MAG: chorismate synthase [Thermoanaerobaculia bacterium]|nr:chorismate synthase [Thermoanaerobaculia bacterium]
MRGCCYPLAMLRRLQLLTGGESHGPGLTALLVGLPAGIAVDFDFLRSEMRRRQHGYGRGRRMVIEEDEVEIRGGVRDGETLGSPIALWVRNRDWENWQTIMDPVETDPHMVEKRRMHAPRPGHVDLAGGMKFLRSDLRDVLERASARETAARVGAAAFAKLFLREIGVEIRSGVRSLGPVGADAPTPDWDDLQAVDDDSPLRAVDRDLEEEMVRLVDEMKGEGDTLGGSVTVIGHGVPMGLGSHVQWDQKLDGRIAQAMMSIPAVKAVELGSALAASRGPGSRAHDPIERGDSGWHRPTNRAGGLEAGITDGADLSVTVYMKPISTLARGMPSVDLDTMEPHRSQYERSDVTALPACGIVAEAMMALVLADVVLEKTGGDSMTEVQDHLEKTLAEQELWPRRAGEAVP